MAKGFVSGLLGFSKKYPVATFLVVFLLVVGVWFVVLPAFSGKTAAQVGTEANACLVAGGAWDSAAKKCITSLTCPAGSYLSLDSSGGQKCFSKAQLDAACNAVVQSNPALSGKVGFFSLTLMDCDVVAGTGTQSPSCPMGEHPVARKCEIWDSFDYLTGGECAGKAGQYVYHCVSDTVTPTVQPTATPSTGGEIPVIGGLLGIGGGLWNWGLQQASNTGQTVSNAANSVGSTVSNFGMGVSNFLNGVSSSVGNAVSNVGSAVNNVVGGTVQAGQNALGSLGFGFSNFLNGVSSTAGNAVNTVSQTGQNLFGGLSGFLSNAGTAVSNAANSAGSTVSNAVSSVGSTLSNWWNGLGIHL